MANPVTISEARLHLRLPSDLGAEEAVEIERMVSVATEYAENFCNRSFTSDTTRTATFSIFPASLHRHMLGLFLPKGKVSSITSITYFDTSYAQQTLATNKYRLVDGGNRAHVYPAMGEQWPTDVANEPENIVVTYVVGETSVPVSVKQAILLVVGSLYEYREDGVIDNAGLALVKAPKGADDLLSPYRQRIA